MLTSPTKKNKSKPSTFFSLETFLSNQYTDWLLFVPESREFIYKTLSSIDSQFAQKILTEFIQLLPETTNYTRFNLNTMLDFNHASQETLHTVELDKESLLLDKLTLSESQSKVIKEDSQVTLQDTSTRSSLVESSRSIESIPEKKLQAPSIPSFYFPYGTSVHTKESLEKIMTKVADIYCEKSETEHRNQFKPLDSTQFMQVTLTCGLPKYIHSFLFTKLSKTIKNEDFVHFVDFKIFWEPFYLLFCNMEALVFGLLKKTQNSFIEWDDIFILAQYVVESHPGLEFLSSMPNFQEKYVETVTERIFFSKRFNWNNNRMNFAEFQHSNILEMIQRLDTVEDMNSIRDAFSYKHFYVIYCKFWELDTDNDLFIDESALYSFENGSLTTRILNRVMQGCGRGRKPQKPQCMTYQEFIPFIISCEDKSSIPAIEYWFRCLDLDGDGRISLYELNYFWEEQYERMLESRMSDPWRFDDFVCSLFDLLQPESGSFITLKDLKKCGNPSLFFDMIFDLKKYDHQIRRIDPVYREMDDICIWEADGTRVLLEGWNKYAYRSYEELSADECQQQQDPSIIISEFDELMDSKILWKEDFEEIHSCHSDEGEEDGEEDEGMGSNEENSFETLQEIPLENSIKTDKQV